MILTIGNCVGSCSLSFPRKVLRRLSRVEDDGDKPHVVVRVLRIDDRNGAAERVLIRESALLGIVVIHLVGAHAERVTDESARGVADHLIARRVLVAAGQNVVAPANHGGFRWTVGRIPLAMPLKVVARVDPTGVAVGKLQFQPGAIPLV